MGTSGPRRIVAGLAVVSGCARRSERSLGARPRQPTCLAREGAPALQPRGADREGEPENDEDRADGAEGIRHRLVRPGPRLEAAASADRLGRGRRDPEGDVDRRQRPHRRGLAVPVPGAACARAGRTRSRSSRRTPTGRSSTGPARSRRRTPRRRSSRRARSAAAVARCSASSAWCSRSSPSCSPARACSRGGGSATAAGSGRSHEVAGAVRTRAGCARRDAGAAGRRVGARLSREDGAVGERLRQRTAPQRRPDVRRGRRAAGSRSSR